ncbi:MAG TPA: VOC family protein [Streptosporangiaceae bacterium]|nr:VOC family protein [Streptosporangiaceae bacterium]
MHLGLVAIVVSEYDPAIEFFTDVLGFELVEDSPSLTNDGRAKRWVVVRPPGAATGPHRSRLVSRLSSTGRAGSSRQAAA